MIDVYTMERPGRPRLAAGLSAGLLAGAILLAWALTIHKQQAIYVPLAAAQPVGAWPISICPPVGWKAEPLKNVPPEIGLMLSEPGGDGRSLAVVRGPVLDSAVPPVYAVGAVDDAVAWLAGGERPKPLSLGSSPFGPLPGIQVDWIVPRRRRPMERVLGSVGVTPQGQVFAILLKCPTRGDRNADRFLKQIAGAVELPGLGISKDIAAAALACGLRFDAPPGILAAASAEGPVKTLQLVSDRDSEKPWTLSLTVTPLAPGREAKALLVDVVRNLTEDSATSASIEPLRLKDREVYRMQFSGPGQPWAGELWAVPLDPQTVVLLAGHNDGAESDLGAACQQIAATVAFAGAAHGTDTKAAQHRGEELLAKIREKHVDEWFDAWAGPNQLYLIDRADQTEGYYRQRYSRLQDDKDVWRVESEVRRILADRHSIITKRDERLSDDGVGYKIAEVRRAVTAGGRPPGRLGEPLQYQESRGPGEDTIHKTVRIGQESYETSFEAGADFACDPVLPIVYWLAATDPQRRPALVRFSDRFEAGLAAQVIYPVGPKPVPGSTPPQTAPAVIIQTDSLMYAYTFYFDDRGRVICVDFGHELAFRTCTEEEFRERFSLVPGLSLSPTLTR